MARGKKLSRQITRYLGSDVAEADLAKLVATLRCVKSDLIPESTLAFLEKVPQFFDVVDSTYAKYEDNLSVTERTVAISSKELIEVNRSVNSMVNSLGQGFLMFDAEGLCGPVYSMACQTLLETMPVGKSIAEVLRLDEERAATLARLLRLAFDDAHAMSFEEIMHFAPDVYFNSRGATIQLVYKPDRSVCGKLDRIVMVATDVSSQIQAQELAEQRKALFESIERALQDRRSFGSYMRHVTELIATCTATNCSPDLPALLREVHTLKAGAGMFRLNALMDAFHEMETAIRTYGEALMGNIQLLESRRRSLIRETDIIIERFKDLLGIDVLRLETENYVDREKLHNYARFLTLHGHHDLHRAFVDQVCAESLVGLLQPFDLLLGDLANNLNKKIKPLRFSGTDVPILADHYRRLFESLTHIFRNIIDHGIEYAADRLKNGKNEAGLIEIRTGLEQAGGASFLTIDIKDDGIGIDIPKMRLRLNEADPDKKWMMSSDREILDGMLSHMVSTSDAVTSYSGRGIGISAVYEEIRKHHGTLSIDSALRQGTVFHIKIPYELKIE